MSWGLIWIMACFCFSGSHTFKLVNSWSYLTMLKIEWLLVLNQSHCFIEALHWSMYCLYIIADSRCLLFKTLFTVSYADSAKWTNWQLLFHFVYRKQWNQHAQNIDKTKERITKWNETFFPLLFWIDLVCWYDK